MTTTTVTPSSSLGRAAAPATPSARLSLVAGLVLAAFGAFSIWVVATRGYFGFLALAGREPWALQMLLDLVISASVATGWMIADARKRRITTWPYLVATVLLGSIGILAYCVRRGVAPVTPPPGT